MINISNLICHFTHHKAGTVWFLGILRNICKHNNWKFQSCQQQDLKSDTDIWVQHHSFVDFDMLGDYVGSHMIRDPRDIIISGYFYHLWTEEYWCNRARKEFEGKSYKQMLNGLNKEEGILFEMRNKGSKVLRDIWNWDYGNSRILEIKYETFFPMNQNEFIRLFKWYGFTDKDIQLGLQIVESFCFKVRSGRNDGVVDSKSHLRKGTPGDWKNHFTAIHKDEFKKLFKDLLLDLGYEHSNDW